MTSLYLNYLSKDPISKYSYILRYWGLGLQHMNFEGDAILSIKSSNIIIFISTHDERLKSKTLFNITQLKNLGAWI